MEVLIPKEFDDFSSTPLTDHPIETKSDIMNNHSDDNGIDVQERNVAAIDKINGDKGHAVTKTISKCLGTSKELSDSEFIVQNLLFDMKSEELSATQLDNKTNEDINNIKHCSNDNTSFFIGSMSTSNDTHGLLNTVDTTYLGMNSSSATIKKRGFSIDEIHKDETSQSTSTYSNDYICFLSEQASDINNLTPFKRSNSYYFDSPVKKLCTTKFSSDDIKNGNGPCDSSYANQSDYKTTLNGFTSIQNDLEIDCVSDRYDGSDSGFGSELADEKNISKDTAAVSTSSLSDKTYFGSHQESSYEDLQRTSNEFLSAMEVLKPKFVDSIPLDVSFNYPMVKGILKQIKPLNYDPLVCDETMAVKKRKNINFANVTVFYFPRVQGFTCVPSKGGSTLGMTRVHSASRVFSLHEYVAEQRRVRRNMVQSSQVGEEVSGNSDDSDSDVGAADVYSESEADMDSDSNGSFLQPVPTRQRRALLKAAGVEKIDSSEKDDCKNIRLSREFCGCFCRVFCDPDTCACFQAGITCQVDRMNFPCGCTVDGCGNSVGRIQFNQSRVRKHFIHTIMRLEIKKREAQEEEHCNKLAMTSSLMSNFSYHDSRHIQPYYPPQHYEQNLNDYNYLSFPPVYENNQIGPESSPLNNYQINSSHNLFEPYQSYQSLFALERQSVFSYDNKPETFSELLQPYSLQSVESTNSIDVQNIPSTLEKDCLNLENGNLGEIIKNTMVESANS